MGTAYLDHDVAKAFVEIPLAGWAVIEALLRLRKGAGGRRFEWTLAVVLVGVYAGIGVGFIAAGDRATITISGWAPIVIGTTILIAGVALRLWAVAALGCFFDYALTIRADHRLVATGPYRHLRHPGYAGLLAALAGTGIALANWVSLLALAVLPLVGILIRIHFEEAALVGALGQDYVSYAARTPRLLPGVW